MPLDWTTEEKVLTDIKRIAAVVWRMNSDQMQSYRQKLQKNQLKILPGYLGNTFLKILEQISNAQTDDAGKIWSALVKDIVHLQDFIHANKNRDQKAWFHALIRLEAEQSRYFRTELGKAFILLLKEKLHVQQKENKQQDLSQKRIHRMSTVCCLEHQKELEKLAFWLMNDSECDFEKGKRQKNDFFSIFIKRAAIPVFAGLSACFMVVWLHTQVERNLEQWNLKQMKVSASWQADIYAEDLQPEQRKKTVPSLQRIKLKKIEKKTEEPVVPKKLTQYQKMSEQYPELFGWLQIPDTRIDLPVMQPRKEKDFYLDHDFTGKASAEGALFADPENNCWPQDGNTIIYGHNMKNGHIFGTLDLYENPAYFKSHREIHFDTIYETGIYEAVAVLKTRILNETEQGFRYYQFFQYSNKKQFRQCLDFVAANQLFDSGSSLQYGDRILMLSTCEYSQKNGRLVIVARKSGMM